jgi:hypothetical protein
LYFHYNDKYLDRFFLPFQNLFRWNNFSATLVRLETTQNRHNIYFLHFQQPDESHLEVFYYQVCK